MTDSYDPSSLMYKFQRKVKIVDQLSMGISQDKISVFNIQALSQINPRFTPAELGFIRLISYLYAIYFELANINIQYLLGKFQVYGLDSDEEYRQHIKHVKRLRTYSFHNLEPGRSHNQKIIKECHDWFNECCQTLVPIKEREWQECLIRLLKDAINFVETILDCVRAIEKDNKFRSDILDEWKAFKKKNRPPHEFDKIIKSISTDMGKEGLDPVKFRKKHYEKWQKELSLLQKNFDFDIEARKLIEYSLLNETLMILPVTGADIIAELKVKPGPEVFYYLKKAQNIYLKHKTGKKELLERLRKEFADK